MNMAGRKAQDIHADNGDRNENQIECFEPKIIHDLLLMELLLPYGRTINIDFSLKDANQLWATVTGNEHGYLDEGDREEDIHSFIPREEYEHVTTPQEVVVVLKCLDFLTEDYVYDSAETENAVGRATQTYYRQ